MFGNSGSYKLRFYGIIWLGNCDEFYFSFEIEVQRRVLISQIFKRDQIPIRPLSNKSNLNTDKPKDFRISPNINEYLQISQKLRSNY